MSKIIERVRQRAVQRFERVAAAFERELREGEHNARIEALLAAQPQEVKKAVLSSREGFMRVLRERTHDFPAPWPCFAMERIEKLAATHALLPRPAQAGRLIGIKKK